MKYIRAISKDIAFFYFCSNVFVLLYLVYKYDYQIIKNTLRLD